MLILKKQHILEGEHTMDEELLERRKSCLMSLSHSNIELGKEVYEFCDLFSHSSEDLADERKFF